MNSIPAESPAKPAAAPVSARPGGQRWPRLWGPRMWKLLAFIVVLLAYRFWFVQHSGISLFFDESQYWDWSRELAWGYFSKPPLIAGLVWLSTKLFGSGLLGVKALSMLTYPLAALGIVGLARALWPTSSGVRTGIVAAAIFMTMPMIGALGMFTSTDGVLILCWVLASWALWRAQVTNRLSLWFVCGLVCGIGLLDKYTMAAFGLTALWALWGVHGPKRGLARPGPWLAVLTAALLLAPNLWWNAQNGFPTLQHTAELTTQSNRSGGLIPALVFALGQVLIMGPVTVIAGVWLYRREKRQAALEQTAGSAPASQWAASSEMLPPSQWKASTQLSPVTVSGEHDPAAAERRPRLAVRSSAYYLASVSSYRFLWAMSLPLQLIAVVQALYADAHVNWAAPSMVGFCLLIASRLSLPLVTLATPRATKWLAAVLISNLALTAVVMHLRDIAGPGMPSQWDILVRMRGWQEAFDDLAPVIEEPTVQGLPVLADKRLLLAQTAYHWRRYKVQTLAWNPQGLHQDHYQLQHSFKNRVGQDVLLISEDPRPTAILQRFAIVRPMKSTKIKVGPDRSIELHAFFLRGFLGYDHQSYLEQSGAHSDNENLPD